jgi:hypothetical protein
MQWIIGINYLEHCHFQQHVLARASPIRLKQPSQPYGLTGEISSEQPKSDRQLWLNSLPTTARSPGTYRLPHQMLLRETYKVNNTKSSNNYIPSCSNVNVNNIIKCVYEKVLTSGCIYNN